MSRQIHRPVTVLLMVFLLLGIFSSQMALGDGGAGLYWGPVEVAGVKVYMTNQHTGYAGPKVGTAPHVNFHVDYKKGFTFKELVNLHITRYTVNGQQCIYVWDKPSGRPGTVVFDNCKSDWNSLRSETKQHVENYIRSKGQLNLTAIQYVALLAILVVAIVVLMALVATIPVLVLAVSTSPDPVLITSLAWWISSFLG